MTLLREIQAEASTAGGDTAAVLRKCKILAARLGSEEFAQWVAWELDGYPDEQPVPSYRRISAQYYANFVGVGWNAQKQPFVWPVLGKEEFEKLNPIEFREGVAKAVALTKGATITRPELAFLVQGKMFPELQCVGAWVEIGGNEFQQLLSAVNNRILDFVLKIEAENPNAGEAPLNTHPVPEEKLRPLIQNFFGPIANIAQNSHGFTQTAHLQIDSTDLKRLVNDLGEHLGELKLNQTEYQRVQVHLATLNAQLADSPNPVIVREAGRTIRNLTEGAISSLIATAAQPKVWAWIQAMLAQF
jgi:hypothetical protein